MRVVIGLVFTAVMATVSTMMLMAAVVTAAKGPAAASPITAVTLIHGIPGQEDELKAHLLSLTAPTLAELGCLRYDLFQSPVKRHEFMRYEVWTSAEALEAHKQTPHLRASFEKRQREGWTTEILTWEPVAANGARR
jgi:quinol monooxygenase YgiN